VPEVERQRALRLATNAADEAFPPSYAVAVMASPSDPHVTLSLTRMQGGVALQQTAMLSRRQTDGEFESACKRVWMFLRGELDRRRPEIER
jgi:hypothetical protein